MKQAMRYQRILIISLLSISVLAPIVLVSNRLSSNFTSAIAHKEFVGDTATIKLKTDTLRLNSVQQDIGDGLKEPTLVVYKDGDIDSLLKVDDRRSFDILERNGSYRNGSGMIQHKNVLPPSRGKASWMFKEEDRYMLIEMEFPKQGQANKSAVRRDANANRNSQTKSVSDEKVREMKDQLIRAKAYLYFASPNSNSHMVKELKLRIKWIEQTLGEATKDSELSRSVVQRMKAMEGTLNKASQIYTDCPAMATKLRAMTYNAEEQVQAHKNQATYLVQLASRTTPKGLHCLSMRLTADYFARLPEEQELPNKQKLHDPDIYHFAVFSDNILACAVVVNSTVSSSVEPKKIVFHIVTDALNLPAMKMWFLSNPPGHAAIEIESIDDFKWISEKYSTKLTETDARDPRYSSALNHLRFYLPEVYPLLDKIVLLDHDVVVQRDLKGLWKVNLKGKVNGAVETCKEGDSSFHRMDMFINFSDPMVAKNFDSNACTWAFGMNVFDLREWRRKNLTAVYRKYLKLGKKQQLWKGGSLPLGLVTFYNQTVGLDQRWHVSGLGYDSGVLRADIDRAAVIHYDGNMKPWLEIGIGRYKNYWNKYINYNHPYLQQCNIHQ